jgi:hypothetical protein
MYEIAKFLFRRRVSNVLSPLYNCGHAPKTPEHVLLRCSETEDDRQKIRQKIAPIALRTRKNLAQLTIKYPQINGKMAISDPKIFPIRQGTAVTGRVEDGEAKNQRPSSGNEG